MKVNPNISPSLHPELIKRLEGYDDTTAPYVSEALTAMDATYQGLDAIYEVREKARQNPVWNDAAQAMEVYKFADKHHKGIARQIDKAYEKLTSGIEYIEKELSIPLDASAAGTFGKEIRDHVRSLPLEKRHAFLNDAIERGDKRTVTAVLGAPSYLSGITDEEQKVRTSMYHRKANPAMYQRLVVMHGARDLLYKSGQRLRSEIQNAMGMTFERTDALAKATSEVERAFIVKGYGASEKLAT